MRAFNPAADWLAGEAFARKTANKMALQKLFYQTLRDRYGLSAQMAVRCIAQVSEAYKRDKSKRPHFRPLAAIPYDQRIRNRTWNSRPHSHLLVQGQASAFRPG